MQELFAGRYFCKDQSEAFLQLAQPAGLDEHPWLAKFQEAARELKIVLPVSFYELAGQARFNSVIGTFRPRRSDRVLGVQLPWRGLGPRAGARC